jgi:3-hydroxy-9,10-secoandrosta-1,3,5(10)-triene-9,17-dione monooxygenase reductase component
MTSIDPPVFRKALGAFPTGVTVVTAQSSDGRDVGVTANSFNSVSLDPPMVLWSLNRASSSLRAFTEASGFAVHILAADQQALSDRFASRREDRFAGLQFQRGIGGAPLFAGCVAQFQCRLAFRYDGGDHEILVGEVVALNHSGLPPLVYHGGRYGAVTGLSGSVPADERGRGGGELMHLLSRAYHVLFAAEREEFTKRGLTEEAYLVLRLLGTQDRQRFDELAPIVTTAGRMLTDATMIILLERGEVALESDGVFALQAAGRQTMLELAAVRMAMEEDAMQRFDRSEVDLLKSLLRRLFRRSRPPETSTAGAAATAPGAVHGDR